MDNFESKITFEIPTNLDFDSLVQSNNFTFLLSHGIVPANQHHSSGGFNPLNDPEYHRFISDIWVGIVLTLMILSTVFCLCSCFLYHKFRQWKQNGRSSLNYSNLCYLPLVLSVMEKRVGYIDKSITLLIITKICIFNAHHFALAPHQSDSFGVPTRHTENLTNFWANTAMTLV
jgi:Commissureless